MTYVEFQGGPSADKEFGPKRDSDEFWAGGDHVGGWVLVDARADTPSAHQWKFAPGLRYRRLLSEWTPITTPPTEKDAYEAGDGSLVLYRGSNGSLKLADYRWAPVGATHWTTFTPPKPRRGLREELAGHVQRAVSNSSNY